MLFILHMVAAGLRYRLQTTTLLDFLDSLLYPYKSNGVGYLTFSKTKNPLFRGLFLVK